MDRTEKSLPGVGFVGAGSMGGPMVERLLAAGAEVHLYARRADVLDRFAALGAIPETSLAELARSAVVLVLCPFSEAQLTEITDGPDGLLAHARPGAVLVQHATVSRRGIERLAAAASGRGVTVLDAPISGQSKDILAGRLTVLVGGERDGLDQVRALLCTYAGTIVHTGRVGTASTVKLINNLTFAAHLQAAGAALALGEKLGVAAPDLLRALTACSANSYALSSLAAAGDLDKVAERAALYLRKDMAVVERTVADLGLDTGVLGTVVRDGPFHLTGE